MDVFYQWMLSFFNWKGWVASQPEELRQHAAQFQHMFNTVGVTSAAVILIVIVSISVCIFYFWWSKKTSPKFKYRYRIGWWLLFLFSTAIIVAIVTRLVMPVMIQGIRFQTNAYWAVSLCNFLYAIILYFFISIIITKALPKYTNASCTPF